MDLVARHAWIRGTVQGVAFRWYARERARELGVVGWIQNLPDGRVEAWIEGSPEPVEAMVAWLRRGPPSAHVAAVEVVEETVSAAERFEVRR